MVSGHGVERGVAVFLYFSFSLSGFSLSGAKRPLPLAWSLGHFVERLVGTARRVALRISLSHCPGPAGPVQRDGGPAAAVLIADVDQQGVIVVLDPEPVPGIALLVKLSGRPS